MSAPRPILLHGVVGGPSCWIGQDGRFPGAAAVAMPGHPAGTALRDLEEAVDWLARLVERVPGPRVLVGHDLGGALALEVALRAPSRVDGVVVIACGPTLDVPDPSPDGAHDARIQALLESGLRRTDGAAGRAIGDALRAAGDETLRADLRLAAHVDLHGRLSTLQTPVLVIAGGQDTVTPPAAVRALADEVPACELALVPDARHVVQADAPREVNLLLAAFLARLELTLEEP